MKDQPTVLLDPTSELAPALRQRLAPPEGLDGKVVQARLRHASGQTIPDHQGTVGAAPSIGAGRLVTPDRLPRLQAVFLRHFEE